MSQSQQNGDDNEGVNLHDRRTEALAVAGEKTESQSTKKPMPASSPAASSLKRLGSSQSLMAAESDKASLVASEFIGNGKEMELAREWISKIPIDGILAGRKRGVQLHQAELALAKLEGSVGAEAHAATVLKNHIQLGHWAKMLAEGVVNTHTTKDEDIRNALVGLGDRHKLPLGSQIALMRRSLSHKLQMLRASWSTGLLEDLLEFARPEPADDAAAKLWTNPMIRNLEDEDEVKCRLFVGTMAGDILAWLLCNSEVSGGRDLYGHATGWREESGDPGDDEDNFQQATRKSGQQHGDTGTLEREGQSLPAEMLKLAGACVQVHACEHSLGQ